MTTVQKQPRRTPRRKTSTRNASREKILRKAYHEFLDGRGRCDIAIAGVDPRDDSRVVMFCYAHYYTWSGYASETNSACPKARETFAAER